MAKSKTGDGIQIQTVTRGTITAYVVGTTPLICNCMSSKARHELLMPDRANKRKGGSLKHDVMQEFRDSVYTDLSDKSPTLITGLSAWFKAAMVGATVDMPDASKAGIGRNVWVSRERVHVYGMPKLLMSVVRSAGMNKTPDVRTRAIIPEWACAVEIEFACPQLTAKAVGELLATAGIVMGVGDWRPEKGSGNYGQFAVVPQSNRKLQQIMRIGRKQQMAAMKDPQPHDDETQKLLAWYDSELQRRGIA